MIAQLSQLASLAKGAGRLVGVLGLRADGTPVRGRKTRLAVAVGALAGSLLAWTGVPVEVTQAVADLVAVALEPTGEP